MLRGKGSPGKWEVLKCEIGRVQGQHVPVRMKGKLVELRNSVDAGY